MSRGLRHVCVNCGQHTVFGPAWKWLQVNNECRKCGLRFDGESAFLGALVINYALVGLGIFVFLMLYVVGVLPVGLAVGLTAGWALLFPFLFFRSAKSLWFMAYYLFVPQELPANGGRSQNPDASGARRR